MFKAFLNVFGDDDFDAEVLRLLDQCLCPTKGRGSCCPQAGASGSSLSPRLYQASQLIGANDQPEDECGSDSDFQVISLQVKGSGASRCDSYQKEEVGPRHHVRRGACFTC